MTDTYEKSVDPWAELDAAAELCDPGHLGRVNADLRRHLSRAEAAMRRVAETAYRLGAKDAVRLCRDVAREEHDMWAAYAHEQRGAGVLLDEEAAAAAACDAIWRGMKDLDPTRAEPDWRLMIRAALAPDDACLRDPDAPCAEYLPGAPSTEDCAGDGHYLCSGCVHLYLSPRDR